ncbi:MAG: UDP-N-acetylmuramate--L-alanine ligase [Mobilibacterium timonense]|nr:UDP-N-acetylmuramate--L-alanine ligase [Mobilibacterium timonense]MBM6991228.1 UDP-N-acetylmuramate--L-alanine ligase [Mobilibacterium timonense]
MEVQILIDISKYKNIHCIGIGGIGLSAVAEILNNVGCTVTGSDMKRSEVTEHLESLGIRISYEHKAENVEGADIIVYSVAVADDNPEIVRAKELGIPEVTRAQMLGAIMEKYRHSVAICGTHGKTTTTSMISLILRNAKYEPTILVGGNVPEIKGNVEIGKHEYFVTEACEYMDSFLNLRPSLGVLLNIDSDHLDYFKDIDHIKASFRQFVTQIPEDGMVVAYGENPFVKEVLKGVKNKITYGYSEGNDYYAENISFDTFGFPQYDICSKGKTLCHIHLGVPGEHNVLNSMAAYAACHYLGVSDEVICETLVSFHGPHRRFDFVGVTGDGVQMIDDYAHHPTEIMATLKAARNVKHDKLWCVFQPHTYTRTKALFDEFVDAFKDVDTLIVTDIYAAREKDVYGVSSYKLVQAMKEKHPERDVHYIQDFEDIAKYLERHAKKDDIVITMGAGDVYKVGRMMLGKQS